MGKGIAAPALRLGGGLGWHPYREYRSAPATDNDGKPECPAASRETAGVGRHHPASGPTDAMSAAMRPLDAQSRWHLRVLGRQVVFLTLIGLPTLVVDRHPPVLYFLELQRMFGLLALVLLALGVATRQPLARSSLCVWDHVAACVLLTSGCSLALSFMR
jgi:hypothetical protein